MRKKIVYWILAAIFSVTLFSCKENSQEKLRKIELERLDEYVQINDLYDYKKSSGLFYVQLEEGNGDSLIHIGDRVQIFYSTWALIDTLYLIDETEKYNEGFRYEPYEFTVGSGTAIDGLEEASTYMRKGTKAKLVIPSELAYGQYGTASLPGFTTIIMEVEVYKVFPIQ